MIPSLLRAHGKQKAEVSEEGFERCHSMKKENGHYSAVLRYKLI